MNPTDKKWCRRHGVVDMHHDCTQPEPRSPFDRDRPRFRPLEDFGDRQLPAELASRLLADDKGYAEAVAQVETELDPAVVAWGDGLSVQERELLEILAEECAEVIQRVTKILRFGKRRNPWDGKDNVDRLENELGDVVALVESLELMGVVSGKKVTDYAVAKLKAFETEENPQKPRLRHAGKALLKRGLSKLIEKLTPPPPRYQLGERVQVLDIAQWHRGVLEEIKTRPDQTKLYQVKFWTDSGVVRMLFAPDRIRKDA